MTTITYSTCCRNIVLVEKVVYQRHKSANRDVGVQREEFPPTLIIHYVSLKVTGKRCFDIDGYYHILVQTETVVTEWWLLSLCSPEHITVSE